MAHNARVPQANYVHVPLVHALNSAAWTGNVQMLALSVMPQPQQSYEMH